jgi:hypothetical protein
MVDTSIITGQISSPWVMKGAVMPDAFGICWQLSSTQQKWKIIVLCYHLSCFPHPAPQSSFSLNLFRQKSREITRYPTTSTKSSKVTPATGQGNVNDIAPMPQTRLPAPTREETYPSPTKYTLAQWVGASSCVPSQRGSPGALGETWLWSLVHFWVASRGISRTPHLGYVI